MYFALHGISGWTGIIGGNIVIINFIVSLQLKGVVLKPLSLHILDTTVGTNAPNVTCRLYKKTSSNKEKFNLLATA